ncbi:MAG TPA: alpha/beta fold hydrolase [Solirubrobacteraceae bacterium]|jgi:pimeloyl-ACP methyl ester carboxylesterase|nr:alpha/beta fold hydrolase [Solirubrobacteraceae bacterium]
MPYVLSGGVRIHYEVSGSHTNRAPLLLSHGFRASARMWEHNVGALCGDREVLAWDMRGHARSDVPADASDYGVEHSIQDMLLLLDVLGAQPAALCGMSLGGYLSLALAAAHPKRVAALILVDTGPGFRRDQPRERWNAFAQRTAAALERDGLAAMRASPEAGSHREAIGLAHTARQVMAQRDARVIDSLEAIAVPTLAVVGALDEDFLSAADYMAAKIPGARKVVLEGAGHAANIEAAEAFNAAVHEFLEGI